MNDAERPEILYHYCSTETFASIVQSRTLRLSSLHLTNDSSEGTLPADVISGMAERDGLPPNSVAGLNNHIRHMLGHSLYRHYLAFCLSEAQDLLSQWRGYADNGRGVAFGFRTKHLEGLSLMSHHLDDPDRYPIRFSKVLYSRAEQEARLQSAYIAASPHIRQSAAALASLVRHEHETVEEWLRRVTGNFPSLGLLNYQLFISDSLKYEFKPSAFFEEREWRLVTYLESHKCKYRPAIDKLIPFTEVPFDPAQICHVILGPKHQTPLELFKSFLQSFGCTASVDRSGVSYR